MTAVQDGAAALDRAKPGWFRSVNTTKLDMESLDQCVLGQVYGSFLSDHPFVDEAYGNGFLPPICVDRDDPDYEPARADAFRRLRDEWVDEITARRRSDHGPSCTWSSSARADNSGEHNELYSGMLP